MTLNHQDREQLVRLLTRSGGGLERLEELSRIVGVAAPAPAGATGSHGWRCLLTDAETKGRSTFERLLIHTTSVDDQLLRSRVWETVQPYGFFVGLLASDRESIASAIASYRYGPTMGLQLCQKLEVPIGHITFRNNIQFWSEILKEVEKRGRSVVDELLFDCVEEHEALRAMLLIPAKKYGFSLPNLILSREDRDRLVSLMVQRYGTKSRVDALCESVNMATTGIYYLDPTQYWNGVLRESERRGKDSLELLLRECVKRSGGGMKEEFFALGRKYELSPWNGPDFSESETNWVIPGPPIQEAPQPEIPSLILLPTEQHRNTMAKRIGIALGAVGMLVMGYIFLTRNLDQQAEAKVSPQSTDRSLDVAPANAAAFVGENMGGAGGKAESKVRETTFLVKSLEMGDNSAQDAHIMGTIAEQSVGPGDQNPNEARAYDLGEIVRPVVVAEKANSTTALGNEAVEKVTKAEKPTAVKTSTEKSNTEKSNTEKSNTEKSNTERSNTERSNTERSSTVKRVDSATTALAPLSVELQGEKKGRQGPRLVDAPADATSSSPSAKEIKAVDLD